MKETRLIRSFVILSLWAGLLLSANTVFAQDDTISFSLVEAQTYATEHSTDMLNAQLDKRISKMFSLEVITEGLPQISSELTYQDNFKLPTSIIPGSIFGSAEDVEVEFGTQHNLNANLNISQLLVDGRYFIGLKANRAFIAISDDQEKRTDIEVRKNVATAYYNALAAVQFRDLLQDNLVTVNKLLSETKAMYENGFVEELDVDRLTLSLANLESKYKQADLSATVALNALKYRMGLSLDTPIKLTDNLETLLIASTDSITGNFDPHNRIEYQLLAKQHEIRGYDAQRLRAGYFPSLAGFFQYGVNAQRDQFNFTDKNEPWFKSGYVGVSLIVPIFDSYKKGAQYKQKKFEQMKIANNMVNFETQAQLEAQNALANYQNAMREYDNQKQSLALAQKIFNKVAIMNREGLSTSLELSQAQSSLNETQGNYIKAIYDLLVAKVELEKAYGNY